MNYKDIREAFEYAKNNPNSTIDNFLEFRSKNISTEDEELFSDLEFVKLYFNIKDKIFNLILLRGNRDELLSNFQKKLIGSKEYYDFYPSNIYDGFYSLISIDDINTDEWDNFMDYDGVKHLINAEQDTEIMFDGMDPDKSESKFYTFCRIQEQKERGIFFWDENRIEIFINNINQLKFDKALNLIRNGI